MKRAILIHGWPEKQEYYNPKYPSPSNCHWLPWLTNQLMIKDIHTVALEMPKSYYPEYEVWKKELERFEVGPETMLVGHSCGGGFLVRWLSENPEQKVGKVVLVAPWLGIRFDDGPFDETFFKFKMRCGIADQTEGLYVFNSTDDFSAIQESVQMIRDQVDQVQYREFSGKGHFTMSSMGTEEFPELSEELLAAD